MLAIIPAKANSERLPGKNMLEVGGKPMVQWTIEAAIDSGIFEDGVVLSSDSEAILSLGDRLGCIRDERSEELTSPTATVWQVCMDIVGKRESKPKCFAVLLPTSPLRTARDIKEAYNIFSNSATKCLISLTEYEHPIQWVLQTSFNIVLPVKPDYIMTKRQDLQKFYKHDGSILMCHTAEAMKAEDFFSLDSAPFFMSPERAIDVNTKLDLKLVEFMMEKQEKI